MAATEINLPFADGVYRFALGLQQIDEIQRACGGVNNGGGIGAVYARVLAGRIPGAVQEPGHPAYAAYSQADLLEPVRQGLIGGGAGEVDGQPVKVTSIRAAELIERYFLPLPMAEQWTLAAAILFAKIEGYEPAKVAVAAGAQKKTAAGSTTRGRSQTAQ